MRCYKTFNEAKIRCPEIPKPKRKWFLCKWSNFGGLPVWRRGLFHFFDIDVIYHFTDYIYADENGNTQQGEDIYCMSIPSCYIVLFGIAFGFALTSPMATKDSFRYWEYVYSFIK